ncbi:transposase (IS4) [Methanocella arvoryzae MRE50]|uniref:Transposase (IS4) n=1 Tax=Methanocella arvoryzae (strain DSM 22066 / NBRC 105507 / MRE50) TaxID=351160 RepID=Q0W4F7_METAR|nr:transposase (IS4) [Methanocella arvoryzae MRE50]
MESFVQVRKRGGQEYLYEVTPYYDKEKKQIRQTVKYLGKNVDGKPVKVRETAKKPRRALSYGEFQPLLKIVEELGLKEILQDELPDRDVKTALLLAFNRVLRPVSMRNVESWYEASYLSEQSEFRDLQTTSQRLSEFLERIGESDVPMGLFKGMIQRFSTGALIYDLTSLSSYSKLINMLEYGYNRDGLSTAQVNLSIVTDKDSGIPLMYDVYPGSIVDVSTLFNTVRRIKDLGIARYTMIIDRGFFSKDNLQLLFDENVVFVIPASTTLKSVKEMITSLHDDIKDPDNLRKYHDTVIFVKPVTIDVDGLQVKGYYYYDRNRENLDTNLFYKRLYNVVDELKNRHIKNPYDTERIVRSIAGKLYNYIEVQRNIDSSLTVTIKKNAVSQRINRMGRYILCYHGEMTWEECLRTYKERDQVEKRFHHLKNDLDAVPLNVRKESTMKGFLFICFLALILRMRLQKHLEETRLDKKYCVEDLILELEKIHMIKLEDGDWLLSELTKKQKDIIERMSLESCYQKTGK